MIYKARAGQASYGAPIGILLLDAFTPFIPGDVANASSYRYPVRFQKVEGFTVKRALSRDPTVFGSLLAATEELVLQGVRAVTGDCGFMGIHQRKLARQLDVPVFLSSLIQIPFITNIIAEGEKIGVITADSRSIDEQLLEAVGVRTAENLEIRGLEETENFRMTVLEESGVLDSEKIKKEVVFAAEQLIAEEPKVRAILLECSCLPPFGADVQEAVRLPVFDYITMIDYVFSAVVKRRYRGIM
ncbi:MAG: aspartate/glutamate racemase family protein [Methanothrix sp.]|nr:MAG: aspartate/glutamate racemase family protein [Methanothrix sp.]